ncbi:hypothetical protein BT63DRAFT_450899 [Microthyrium microscopicum]|uniref:Uncharacterized protein n=1 Tax=Microthyrium microscopicum TaxID=703497 RepID=A0A6A6UKS5_9PEZI|nr:hypothetical protein BT63DRAFT_450899 [Microthyrium microscopicum]
MYLNNILALAVLALISPSFALPINTATSDAAIREQDWANGSGSGLVKRQEASDAPSSAPAPVPAASPSGGNGSKGRRKQHKQEHPKKGKTGAAPAATTV